MNKKLLFFPLLVWAVTYGTGSAYYLYFGSYGLDPQGSGSRDGGLSVRLVR